MTTTQDRIVEAIESLTVQMAEAPQLGDICAALNLGRTFVARLLNEMVEAGQINRFSGRQHYRYRVGPSYIAAAGSDLTACYEAVLSAIEALTEENGEGPKLGEICDVSGLSSSRATEIITDLMSFGRIRRICAIDYNGAIRNSRYVIGGMGVVPSVNADDAPPQLPVVRSKPFKGLRWRVLRAAVFADVEPRIDDVAVRVAPPMNAPAEVALKRSMVAVDSYPARAG